LRETRNLLHQAGYSKGQLRFRHPIKGTVTSYSNIK
jgi:hypothetical protein